MTGPPAELVAAVCQWQPWSGSRIPPSAPDYARHVAILCATRVTHLELTPFFGAWALRSERRQFAVLHDDPTGFADSDGPTVYLRVDELHRMGDLGHGNFRFLRADGPKVMRGYEAVRYADVVAQPTRFLDLVDGSFAAADRAWRPAATRRRPR